MTADRSTPQRLLGIDGGKTKTLVELSVKGRTAARIRGPGLEMITAPGGPEAVHLALAASLAPLGNLGQLDTVCIGMNAVHAPSPEAEHVARILRGLVVADRIVVTSDMVTTYCGALGLVPGAVVAAGTGTIAMGLSSAGEVSRVDGWGYLLGDDGSGYAIGSHGLRSALRAVDGRGGSQVLASYAAKRFGNPTQMSRKIHGAQVPARVIADFSRAVAAAAIEGDSDAIAIWAAAGRDLARTVVSAAAVLQGPTPTAMSWAGGLFSVGALLQEPFQEEIHRLAPGAAPRPPAADAVGGALLLAGQPRPALTSVTLWDQGAS
ncbi:N-acetylglucosamine kinase [Micromonospora sp. NBC_01412]|uniref:N-acetylglucosamine kinase n=1 Tax=Micromonospora sp. NBC_01412 TaxID=2903590 RepID=UPI00324727E3